MEIMTAQGNNDIARLKEENGKLKQSNRFRRWINRKCKENKSKCTVYG